MGWFSDLTKGNKHWFSEQWKAVKKDPERLLLGAMTPVGTKLWNGVLDKDWDPVMDAWGGPSAHVYKSGEAQGIDMGAAHNSHRVARIIAANAMMGGAGGGAGGEGPAGVSTVSQSGNGFSGAAGGSGAGGFMNNPWVKMGMSQMGNVMGGGRPQQQGMQYAPIYDNESWVESANENLGKPQQQDPYRDAMIALLRRTGY